MSEFQNKAVRLMIASTGEASLGDLDERRRNVLTTAMELYLALGGTFEQLEACVADATLQPRRVDMVVGDMMMELAAVSHIHDIDIMQAAHNILDTGPRQATLPTPHKAGQSESLYA
ncbi:hypothetical protein ACIQUG_10415 [Ensifer sp. NPDC090286]|uniref:hypothetical protein n=1 Tax=Ensifer sp. NPDC090286 TaxID=3363991 RepID=UPI00383A7722